MKTCGHLLVVCLAGLGLALVEGPARADDVSKDVYTVVVKSVKVQTKKGNETSWDVDDGKPDLCVVVRNLDDKDDDKSKYKTKTKDDSYEADFNEPTTVKVRPGQTLEFEILDKDLLIDDTIGRVEKKMTADVLGKGKLTCEKFGQVITLEIEVKRL